MPHNLGIPSSDATVDVKILHAASVEVPASFFLHPVVPGHEQMMGPAYAFLIENGAKDKRIVFDLGIRKDLEEFPPHIRKQMSDMGMKAVVERDVATQLTQGGVDLNTVDAIVWSHSHLDHTGDPSTFPPSTEVIFGPGTKKQFFPPYPENPESHLLENDFKGRKVTEIASEEFTLSIGDFKGYDYFGDGSFYLLDVPGHCQGHINGLARVTPSTFILMGGDTCHHAGQIRPSSSLHGAIPCPASLLSNISSSHFPNHVKHGSSLSEPLLTIPPQPPSAYTDSAKTLESIEKLRSFDGHPDVFVILAHDSSVQGLVDLFPEKANDWQAKGWKKAVWDFLRKDNSAFRFA